MTGSVPGAVRSSLRGCTTAQQSAELGDRLDSMCDRSKRWRATERDWSFPGMQRAYLSAGPEDSAQNQLVSQLALPIGDDARTSAALQRAAESVLRT
jgi:hypothetical protein